jgi:hypothetical protein
MTVVWAADATSYEAVVTSARTSPRVEASEMNVPRPALLVVVVVVVVAPWRRGDLVWVRFVFTGYKFAGP